MKTRAWNEFICMMYDRNYELGECAKKCFRPALYKEYVLIKVKCDCHRQLIESVEMFAHKSGFEIKRGFLSLLTEARNARD